MVNIFSFFSPNSKIKPQQHFLCLQGTRHYRPLGVCGTGRRTVTYFCVFLLEDEIRLAPLPRLGSPSLTQGLQIWATVLQLSHLQYKPILEILLQHQKSSNMNHNHFQCWESPTPHVFTVKLDRWNTDETNFESNPLHPTKKDLFSYCR